MRKWPARVRDALRMVHRRLVPVVAFALVVAFPSWHAAAQDGPLSPLGLRLGTSLTRDSNVFRVPVDAADPQLSRGKSGRSDTLQTTYVGLDLDKSYSRQRFTASITKTETRYDKFTSLDRDVLDYNGKLHWELGSRLRGVLHADHAETVVEFEDAQSTTFNRRIIDIRYATIDVSVYDGWHLLAGFYDVKSTTSQLFLPQPSADIKTREVGLRYVTGSLNSVTLTRRSRSGVNLLPGGIDFVNLIDTDFTENESELQATWNLTGASTLNGRLTRLERNHHHLPQRDFSGTAGELGYVWALTGKLSLRLSATRSILPWTADTQASYRVDDVFVFRPTWQVTDKVKLSLTPSSRVSDFRGPVAPLTGPLRRDNLRSVTFTAEWLAYRRLVLVATLQHSQRKSTHPELEFKDSTATLNASLKF